MTRDLIVDEVLAPNAALAGEFREASRERQEESFKREAKPLSKDRA